VRQPPSVIRLRRYVVFEEWLCTGRGKFGGGSDSCTPTSFFFPSQKETVSGGLLREADDLDRRRGQSSHGAMQVGIIYEDALSGWTRKIPGFISDKL